MCYRDTIRLCLGYNEENKPKRRVSRRLGKLVLAFFFYSCFFSILIISTSSIGIMELRRDSQEVTTGRSGPNDVKRIVWAIR